MFRFWHIASVLLLTATASSLPATQQDFEPADTISRDVLILGGGATGTYAGVRLKDEGKSVVIVERNDYLGGRTHTLDIDGHPIDYGVVGYFNDKVTRNYLRRLDVPWELVVPSSLITDEVNFRTGEKVPPNLDILELPVATLLYRKAIQQFDFLQEGGYDKIPDPVPEELLIPFGDFVEKYALEGALGLVLMFAQTVGEILAAPTFEVVRDFGIPHINALLSGYIRPKNGLGTLYREAAQLLAPDVLYQTTVVELTRPEDGGIRAVVQDADGSQKLIRANKLLVTVPSTLTNLQPFDLDQRERKIFGQWQHGAYYAAVLNDTGIPSGINVANSDPTQIGNLPRPPYQWRLDYAGVPDHLMAKIISVDPDFSAQDAKDLVASDILRMGEAGTYQTREPNFVAFESHTPITLSPSLEGLEGGFYRDLSALQGYRDTFYTGMSVCSDYSSLLWAFTDKVLEQLID